MNTTVATFVLCFAFLYLAEGIDIAIHEKVNIAYKATHIVYPLYMICAMIYFLVSGVIR